MARRGKNKKPAAGGIRAYKVSSPVFKRLATGLSGAGAHRDPNRYSRKAKHKKPPGEEG